MIIYIAIQDLSKSYTNQLECKVGRTTDNKIHFDVINGCWDGYFDLEQQFVYVKGTREKVPAKIVYVGRAIGEDYNERINSVIEHIRTHGPVSGAELREHGYIPGNSRPATSIKKRSKSNGIQTIILSEISELIVDKKSKVASLLKNNSVVRSMSLEV